ncbi:hypothetical protein EDD21DRAFT_156117 [Dissophora ornata]|nr:hypothetical protein EDD21DRAFT_156117 [Dissophora ornata]
MLGGLCPLFALHVCIFCTSKITHSIRTQTETEIPLFLENWYCACCNIAARYGFDLSSQALQITGNLFLPWSIPYCGNLSGLTHHRVDLPDAAIAWKEDSDMGRSRLLLHLCPFLPGTTAFLFLALVAFLNLPLLSLVLFPLFFVLFHFPCLLLFKPY